MTLAHRATFMGQARLIYTTPRDFRQPTGTASNPLAVNSLTDPSYNMPTHESQSPNIFPDDTSIDSGHSFALPTDSGPVDVTWLLHAISQPQRPGDACFWCHESGHQVLQCPKFSETLRHPHMVTFLKRLLDT